MLAFALCSFAIAYLYVSPIVRRCCRNARPVSAELVDEFKDL